MKINIGPEKVILPGGLQPFMFQLKTGRLVVQAQLETPLGTMFPGRWATLVSDDGGASWQPWSRADVTGGSPFFEGCATHLSDGLAILLEWSARGPQPDGCWIARLWESHDNWDTAQGPFEARIPLPMAKGGFDDDGHPVPELFLHRSLIELPHGDLLLTAYGWFEGDETPSTYRPSMNKLRCILLRSSDRGRNWRFISTIAVDPTIGEEGFNEPVLVRLTKGRHQGRLIALLRTGSNKTFAHNPIYQTESDDEGQTWTPPRPLNFENVDPDLIEMESGVLVASCGWRTAESRVNLTSEPKSIGPGHGNYLVCSHDGGESWTNLTQITDTPSSCYTTVREIAPGKLLLVYDIGDSWQHVWQDYEGIKRGIGCRVIEVSSSGA
ncbi:MAG TPA: sialidase family protein [Abditibacteriaceae bacterium]|nr:sialidase family protein [Abditibacteriaceae bacterium]